MTTDTRSLPPADPDERRRWLLAPITFQIIGGRAWGGTIKLSCDFRLSPGAADDEPGGDLPIEDY